MTDASSQPYQVLVLLAYKAAKVVTSGVHPEDITGSIFTASDGGPLTFSAAHHLPKCSLMTCEQTVAI